MDKSSNGQELKDEVVTDEELSVFDQNFDVYKIPFFEMTSEIFMGIFPDDYLYFSNVSIENVNITIDGRYGLYTDSYSYTEDGHIASARTYSDGLYFKRDFRYSESLLVSDSEYIDDNYHPEMLHEYTYIYSNEGYTRCTVFDEEKEIVNIYRVLVCENEIVIQIYDKENMLRKEYSYRYEDDNLKSIYYKSPNAGVVFITEINYVQKQIDVVKEYSEDYPDDLFVKKEYEYNNEGRLVSSKITHRRNDGHEIDWVYFSGHDNYGNWTMAQGDGQAAKREIVYRK
jgi:hypothetical protein